MTTTLSKKISFFSVENSFQRIKMLDPKFWDRQVWANGLLFSLDFTSHQQLRSYGDRTLVESLVQKTGEARDRTMTPGLQGE